MAQSNSQRTKEELDNPEFNYYLAFKIPLIENNITKIDNKIRKSLNDTGGSVLLRRLNELKDDSIEVMCNDATFDGTKYIPNSGARAKEAASAKKFKLKDAVNMILILCKTRNILLKSEIQDLCNNANKSAKYFSEEEFFQEISYLSGQGIKIVDNTDRNIPLNNFEKADSLLLIMDKKDLYDFLGVTNSATDDQIKMAIDKKNTEANEIRCADQKKAQSIGDLVSSASGSLLNTVTRKEYDRYLIIKDKVWGELAKRKKFGIKELSMDEYRNYTQIAIDELKISLDEAEKMIAIGCKYYHLTLVGNSNSNAFEVCPFPDCGKIFVKGAKSCPHCGKALEVICWNCKQQTRITKDDRGCSTCGATNHAHELFNLNCQKIEQLLRRPTVEISELQTAFLNVKNVVPNYSARADSTVAKKVKEYSAIIDERIKQEETIGAKYRDEVSKIQQLIAKHCYQAALANAKSLLIKYNSYNIDNSKKLIADVSNVIQTAQNQVNLAKQYIAQGNVNQAITFAAKAIDICADFTDARQIMQKYPPRAVTNLRVTANKGKVRLEWDDNLKQDFITYVIIKKIGIAPKSIDDGALVDNSLSVRFFEDENIVSATPYYYAVFVERYGAQSPITASTEPVIIYADVINMHQEVVDSGVKVSWEAPQNVKSIEVWRNNGTIAPLRAGEGTKIESSNNGFVDKCADVNAYLVICNYEVKGKIVQSQGIRAIFKPYEKIEPLEGIKIEHVGTNRYTFSYSPGCVGKIKLYYSNTKLDIPFNSKQKYIDFNSICKGLMPLQTTLNANGELTFSLVAGKIYQIYPIVITEQLFIVSSPHLINTIEGISKCAYSVSDGTVSVGGVLHPQAQSIVVRISDKQYIEKMEGGEKFTFKPDDFRRNNKLELKLKSNTINFITLFVEFKSDGVISYSHPIKLDPPINNREPVTILFTMDYNVSPIKPFKVTINFEANSEIEIPKLLLIQGVPRPMHKTSGKLCEVIKGIVLKKNIFTKRYVAKKVITVNPVEKGTKFALFLDEETSSVQMKEVHKL